MSANIDLENSEYEIIELSSSKRQSILESLNSSKLLNYGSTITESDVESIMQVSMKDLSDDKWNLLKLQLREIVKSQGFYITSRGRQGDLYILLPHEMPLYNEQKNRSAFNNLKLRQRALHMIDSSLLNNENRKKLEFEILRNASLEIEMANKMKERCRY